MIEIFRPPDPEPDDNRFAIVRGLGPVEFNDDSATWYESTVPGDWIELIPNPEG